jgi:hypothetical protein
MARELANSIIATHGGSGKDSRPAGFDVCEGHFRRDNAFVGAFET